MDTEISNEANLILAIFDKYFSARIFILFQRFEIKDWEFLWRAKLLRKGKIIDESMETDESYESQSTQGSLDINKLVLII